MKIGRHEYVDGATGMNNPVQAVLDEARSIWGSDTDSRIQCIVSIGTGQAELKDFGDNLKEVVETLKSIATETENTEERFGSYCRQHSLESQYFRFNVEQGLGKVQLDEIQGIDTIEAATVRYLENHNIKARVQQLCNACALRQGMQPAPVA